MLPPPNVQSCELHMKHAYVCELGEEKQTQAEIQALKQNEDEVLTTGDYRRSSCWRTEQEAVARAGFVEL